MERGEEPADFSSVGKKKAWVRGQFCSRRELVCKPSTIRIVCHVAACTSHHVGTLPDAGLSKRGKDSYLGAVVREVTGPHGPTISGEKKREKSDSPQDAALAQVFVSTAGLWSCRQILETWGT